MTDFIFLGSKITVDFTCSHEKKKKMLAPWKESCDKPRQCIEKLRHHFADRGLYSQSYICPVIMYGWELDHKEGWAPENWYFGTVLLEKTLESPWTARRSNESILKEINPEYSLEGLMLQSWSWCSRSWSWSSNTLATWFEEPTHWKRSWCY